jgi:hypothetical protein
MKRLPSILLLAAMLLLPASQTTKGQSSYDRRDGNWWTGLTGLTGPGDTDPVKVVKLAYVAGIVDGVQLGMVSSTVLIPNKSEKPACVDDVAASSVDFRRKYLNHVTNDQISDGLDTFYADYRNRRIMVNNAILPVLMGIAGTPEEQVNKLIENLRKQASDY